jgi:hypothetical protein
MANQPVCTALSEHLRYDLSRVAGFNPYDTGTRSGSLGELHPDAGIEVAYAQAISLSFLKKFQDEITGDVDVVARQKFLAANSKCDEWRYEPKTDREEILLGTFRRHLCDFFSVTYQATEEEPQFLDWSSVLDWSKISYFADNGPGSSLGATGTSWYEKFTRSPLTYSREFLRDLFVSRCAGSDSHRQVEAFRQEQFGGHCEKSSKFSTVPKTVSESRVICIEPSLNTFFQKGAQAVLERQLKRHFGIDLQRQQSLNRLLAQIGSATGSFSTIDLSSASDTISRKMLEWCAGKQSWLHYLDALRTPSTRLPDGSVVELSMISSMGNATTFPLQTAIFCAVVFAVYDCYGIKPVVGTDCYRGAGNFGVNGDDLVVLTELDRPVRELLSLLGFTVNAAKSFNNGFFRESCGGDFYRGRNVRGVYCKTLRTDQDILSTLNRLTDWSARSGILLPSTCQFLIGLLQFKPKLIPPFEAEVGGFKVPQELSGCRPYWSHNLQCNLQSYTVRRVKPRTVDFNKFVKGNWSDISVLSVLLSASKGEGRSGGITPRNAVVIVSRRFFTSLWDVDEVGVPLPQWYRQSWKIAAQSHGSRLLQSRA